LDRGRNSMGIWQDLVDRHGFNGGYQSVCHRYSKYPQIHRLKNPQL
jgi:hypothetical protein